MVIRINKQAYEALKIKAKEQDRSLSWMASKLILERIESPPRANPSKTKTKVHPEFARCKELFMNYWKFYNDYDFMSWSGAQAKALNSIIKKIEAQSENKAAPFNVFEIILKNLPEFYKNKTLTAINGNYDTIIAEIKAGTGNKNKQALEYYSL